MKILLVNHFPLEGSGSGTYTMNTAQHLAKRGHDVCIVFPENRVPAPLDGVSLRPVYFDAEGEQHAPAGDPAANDALAGKPAAGDGTGDGSSPTSPLPFNFPCFTTHPRSLTTFDDLDDDQLERYLAAFTAAVNAAVREFEPDIIHAQHVWLLANVATKTGVPTIVTAHGTDMMGYRKWPRFHELADETVRLCHSIIAISKDNYEDTVSTIPAAAEKMVLLLNGYNEDVFYREDVDRASLLKEHHVPYQEERVVLFAGKLTNFKGVDVLLRAAARYEREHPDVVTLLAGSGEEREALERLHAELGLSRTYFLGHQLQDSLRRLYNAADLFAMPSRREPFGLVALEAMACGLPVVATNQGGLPEFVTPECGTLVDVDDDEALARAIVGELDRTAATPLRRERIAESVFERYAQSKFVVRLEALYQRVISA
ncbi:glycosyltransferase [Adlercreutzia sp. ZJ242]|uniref:glycosyltransferase n=1 Tax=Adlercreutzia sp. ZJ242 TaxID=2709409 RepID=UPI0013EE03FD|nr:glycosyltransferase [Adlercreutzia sp. ZJ242]